MKKTVIIVAIVSAVIILCACSFMPVSAGHSGVVLTLGAVSDKVLSEGLHTVIPFVQTVVEMNNRTQVIETSGTASSKDLQVVTYSVSVNYRVRSEASAELYQNVGQDYSNIIISPAIQESIKAVSAKYTAEELITERQLVGDEIKEALGDKIGDYGITVEIFNIVDFDFSEEFNAAVEAKQTAQQEALKAEQDLARIEVEAKQKITQAEAESESINLIQDALQASPDYIEYVKWSKWDGKLPTVMGGSTGTLIDMSDIEGTAEEEYAEEAYSEEE